MLWLKLISTILFWGFIIASFIRWGIPETYSSLSYKWGAAIWSNITMLSAMLIVPVMLDKTYSSSLQLLCFFTPAWLIFVGATPNYLESKLDGLFHDIFTALAIICNLLWLFLVVKGWVFGLLSVILITIIALLTRTLKTRWRFWTEIMIFLSTYMIIWFF